MNVNLWLDTYFREEFGFQEVSDDQELINDLDLNSLEIFNMTADLEDELQIRIPEKLIRKMVTVGDMKKIIGELAEDED